MHFVLTVPIPNPKTNRSRRRRCRQLVASRARLRRLGRCVAATAAHGRRRPRPAACEFCRLLVAARAWLPAARPPLPPIATAARARPPVNFHIHDVKSESKEKPPPLTAAARCRPPTPFARCRLSISAARAAHRFPRAAACHRLTSPAAAAQRESFFRATKPVLQTCGFSHARNQFRIQRETAAAARRPPAARCRRRPPPPARRRLQLLDAARRRGASLFSVVRRGKILTDMTYLAYTASIANPKRKLSPV